MFLISINKKNSRGTKGKVLPLHSYYKGPFTNSRDPR